MRQTLIWITSAILIVGLMSACGPSEEEKRQQEQARRDSLEQVRQQRLQQQRLDSIRQARQDSINAAEQKKQEESQIKFDENGSFAVQVEAWRSRDKAQGQVGKWNNRGFENAYVVKHGNEETGNIWFRVRLGKFATKAIAEKFREKLMDDYNARSWISLTKEEKMEEEEEEETEEETEETMKE